MDRLRVVHLAEQGWGVPRGFNYQCQSEVGMHRFENGSKRTCTLVLKLVTLARAWWDGSRVVSADAGRTAETVSRGSTLPLGPVEPSSFAMLVNLYRRYGSSAPTCSLRNGCFTRPRTLSDILRKVIRISRPRTAPSRAA